MPTFTIYCKTSVLADIVFLDLIDYLPDFFTITDVVVGIPPITIGNSNDPLWSGFPFPKERGVVYVFDDDIPAHALGGGGDMRASIHATPYDQVDVLGLRLWHELLHAVGQPADDMSCDAAEWQTTFERILWFVWRVFGAPVDIPFWQRKYYAWLTARAEMDPLL